MSHYHAYIGAHESACHVCLQEIPDAGALSAEGKEYLYFFCGQGCYVHWQHEGGNTGNVARSAYDRR